MFGIGGTELFLILLFGFLLFGPDKLPEIAKTAGRAISKFKNAQEEVTKVVQNEIYDPKSDEPFKNPLEAVEKMGKKSENKTVAKQESFSERKARYDRERAARRAAEQEKGEGAAAGTAAAGAAKTAAAKPAPKASAAKPAAVSAKPAPKASSTASKPATTTTPKPAATSKPAAAPKPAPTPKPASAVENTAAKPAAPVAAADAATEEKGE